MSCCTHCQATACHFGPTAARHDLARYRRKGPDATTRLMLASLRGLDLGDATLLDIGAGLGVIHHELFRVGLGRAIHVDAAPAYIAEARAEVERRGHHDRVEFVEGDFVACADALGRVELVTLDRVICCYPDDVALVTRSAEKAARYYALSVPRDRWYVRAAVAVENAVRRLRGNAFRAFVHPTSRIDRVLRAAGFLRRRRRTTLAWEVMLYERRT